MPFPPSISDRLLFGAAFYDEYRVTGSLDSDLDLMVDAGFSVIRVGESVWSSWEPRDGEFTLDWLQPVLDGAHARGIAVVLGTPTYAVPPWLRTAHPEIAAHDATDHVVPWGYRQEIDVAHPVFRRYAERVIRAVIGRYAEHPAVIGFQVDNEPGLHLLHNPDVFAGFVADLADRYGNVDALNQAWGLTFWSNRLTSWDELWAPDGNSSPQYALEWRRYQNKVIADFIGWQADIVREYSGENQFVTTCISYERPAVDDVAIVRSLDVTAGNPYYKMQEALRIGVEVPRPEIWWSSGVWGLFEQADRMFSTAQGPFLVMETNAQSIGQSHWQNHPPYPGQIAQAALALISRGARMIEYWQWQTLHTGIETYWGGVLPHSGRPGRIYGEIAELGRRLRALEPALVGYRPDRDVTMLYSTDTKNAYQFYPPLADTYGGPDENAYLRIFDAFYRGAFDARTQVGIIHLDQLLANEPEANAAAHPVLVVPSLYVADDAALDALVAYASAGGHLIAGIRTGYGDELARARQEEMPARLGAAAGIQYEEYSSLDQPVGLAGPLVPDGMGADLATGWADAIAVHGAEVLASYAEGIYRDLPAVTTAPVGLGRITYVGTVPNRELAAAVLLQAVPSPRSASWAAPPTVTLISGQTSTGRLWFATNWSPDAAWVVPPVVVSDEAGAIVSAGEALPLPPWSVRVLTEHMDGLSAHAGPHFSE